MTAFSLVQSATLELPLEEISLPSGDVDVAKLRASVFNPLFLQDAEMVGKTVNSQLEEFWNGLDYSFQRSFYGWSVSPQGVPLDHILSGDIEDESGLPLHFIHKDLKKALEQALALSHSLDNMTIESVLVLRGDSAKTPVDNDFSNGLVYLNTLPTNSGIQCSKLSVSLIKNNLLSVNIFDADRDLLEGTLSNYDDSNIPVMELDIPLFYQPRLGLENL